MLFGKVTKTRFSIDYAPPLTIVQALCVALSSFADKLMVTVRTTSTAALGLHWSFALLGVLWRSRLPCSF